jgi:uncharacterized small protein (DUF1192 family)
MDKAALRVTGKPWRTLDEMEVARVREATGGEFVRTLSVEELEAFLAQLEDAIAELKA